MAEQKTKPTKVSVTKYINAIPHEGKRKDALTILNMMKKITKLQPAMWGPTIIGFGKYHYKYESGHEGEAPLIGFAPRKQKLVLYVLTSFKGKDELLKKLGKHSIGKVCLYINKLADVDLKILEKIIVGCWNHVKGRGDKI